MKRKTEPLQSLKTTIFLLWWWGRRRRSLRVFFSHILLVFFTLVTAVMVAFASAFRALNYGKEMERNRDFSEASITLDTSQALMIPVMSSCSLLLMFYLFSSVSQLLTAFTAIASVSSLFFGANVMVAVATQQASNPVHTVANSLNLPGLQLITKKLA